MNQRDALRAEYLAKSSMGLARHAPHVPEAARPDHRQPPRPDRGNSPINMQIWRMAKIDCLMLQARPPPGRRGGIPSSASTGPTPSTTAGASSTAASPVASTPASRTSRRSSTSTRWWGCRPEPPRERCRASTTSSPTSASTSSSTARTPTGSRPPPPTRCWRSRTGPTTTRSRPRSASTPGQVTLQNGFSDEGGLYTRYSPALPPEERLVRLAGRAVPGLRGDRSLHGRLRRPAHRLSRPQRAAEREQQRPGGASASSSPPLADPSRPDPRLNDPVFIDALVQKILAAKAMMPTGMTVPGLPHHRPDCRGPGESADHPAPGDHRRDQQLPRRQERHLPHRGGGAGRGRRAAGHRGDPAPRSPAGRTRSGDVLEGRLMPRVLGLDLGSYSLKAVLLESTARGPDRARSGPRCAAATRAPLDEALAAFVAEHPHPWAQRPAGGGAARPVAGHPRLLPPLHRSPSASPPPSPSRWRESCPSSCRRWSSTPSPPGGRRAPPISWWGWCGRTSWRQSAPDARRPWPRPAGGHPSGHRLPEPLPRRARSASRWRPEPRWRWWTSGTARTSVAVGRPAEGLVFARTFAGGGRDLTRALAAEFQVGLPEAEAWKERDASLVAGGGPEHDRARAALLRALAPIVREVRATLKASSSREHQPAARLLVAGGSARLPGLAEHLGNELRVPDRSGPAPRAGHRGHRAAGPAPGRARPTPSRCAQPPGSRGPRFNLRQGEFAFRGHFDYLRERLVRVAVFAGVAGGAPRRVQRRPGGPARSARGGGGRPAVRASPGGCWGPARRTTTGRSTCCGARRARPPPSPGSRR